MWFILQPTITAKRKRGWTFKLKTRSDRPFDNSSDLPNLIARLWSKLTPSPRLAIGLLDPPYQASGNFVNTGEINAQNLGDQFRDVSESFIVRESFNLKNYTELEVDKEQEDGTENNACEDREDTLTDKEIPSETEKKLKKPKPKRRQSQLKKIFRI